MNILRRYELQLIMVDDSIITYKCYFNADTTILDMIVQLKNEFENLKDFKIIAVI